MIYQATKEKREEVEKFKRTSARLVAIARKNPKAAHRMLREAGYFKIVPEDELKSKK